MPWPLRSTSFPWESPQGVAIPRAGHFSPLLGPAHETGTFRPGQGSSHDASAYQRWREDRVTAWKRLLMFVLSRYKRD